MSGSWPPNPPQYPDRGGQSQPNQGYGPREQSYGGYGPPSGGRQRPQYEGDYDAPQPDYSGYAPPSQGRPQQGGWGPSQGGLQDAPQPRGPYSPGGLQPDGQYGAPYGQQYGQQYGYDRGFGSAPETKQRNLLLPVLLAVLVVLVGAAAAGAYALTHRAQPTTTTGTPGIPAGFKAYDDAATHVHLILPTDWTSTGTVSGAQGLIVASPDQNSGVAVKQYNVVANNLPGMLGGFFTGMAGSAGSVSNKSAAASTSVAGQTWSQESADVTRDGATYHVVVLATTYNQSTYLVAYFSLKSTFASADKSYFQPILKSFAFTQ
jgi:hypothetical protein